MAMKVMAKILLLSAPLVLTGVVLAHQSAGVKEAQVASEVLGETTIDGSVLAEQDTASDYRFSVNVPASFASATTFEEVVEFMKDITAPNVIYSIKPGSGISVSSGQTPTIANTGVLSFQSKTGAISLEAGSGVGIDGLKITNSDTGSSQNIFKKIAVSGQTDLETDGNADTLTFAGSGITITTDSGSDTVTFTSTPPDFSLSGWTDGGSTLYLTSITDKVGIGTSSPTSNLHVVGTTKLAGNSTFGGATTDTLTFTGRVANGTSLLPNTDLGSDIGSSGLRFNNLWVANINSNSSSSFAGQTTFTYEPTDTTYAQASVIINPTDPVNNGLLFVTSVAGYSRSGIDEDGDLTVGYAGNVTLPASDYPLSIYNHGTSLMAYFDTSGNLNIGGSIISGSGISSTGDFTMTAGTSIVPTVDQVNAISIANSTSVDFVSFDTANSRVGIGTTTPDTRFHVVGGDSYLAPDSGYTFDNASANEDLYVYGNLEVDGNTYLSALFLEGSQVSASGTELSMLNGTTVTNGGVVFGNGTYLTQDATNFFWDDTNNRLGLGTAAPAAKLDVLATTEQLRLSYSAATYASFTVSSTGIVTLADTGNPVANFSSAQASFEVPTSFNAAGDVSLAYDLVFTNQSNAVAKSYGPLAFEAGESWESSNITLTTFNSGNVVVDSQALIVNYAATVSGQLVVGTPTAPANIGNFYLTNSSTSGKALAILNQTETADIFTASASGVPKFVIDSTGNVGVGTATPSVKFAVEGGTVQLANNASSSVLDLGRIGSGSTYIRFSHDNGSGVNNFILTTSNTGTGDIILQNKTSETMRLSAGNVGIGTTVPVSKLHVSGGVTGKALVIFNDTGDQALFTASAAGVPKVTIKHNGMTDSSAGGVATLVKAGTVSDGDFTDAAVAGLIAIDSTNHRIYWKEGEAWGYAAQSAGFQIPVYETEGLAIGDFLMPYAESTMSDGAVHGMYKKFTDVKNELLSDVYGAIAGLIIRVNTIENFIADLGERMTTKETRTEKLCLGTEEDELCFDKGQIQTILDVITEATASAGTVATPSAEVATPAAIPTATPAVEQSGESTQSGTEVL